MKHAPRIEERGGGFLPQIAMAGQFSVIEAEGGHECGVMRGEEAGVVAQAQIGGRNALGVVVSGDCGGAVGIVDQRALQLLGNHAQIVVVHAAAARPRQPRYPRDKAWPQRFRR